MPATGDPHNFGPGGCWCGGHGAAAPSAFAAAPVPLAEAELDAIRGRDAVMHSSLWESWAVIEEHGGDIGPGNRAVRDRRSLLDALDAERARPAGSRAGEGE
jgi:hypothetical protein